MQMVFDLEIYLWSNVEGVYLSNEDFTMWCKPYFISHPQRTLLLKERFEPGMSKVDLLNTVTNDDLAKLVNNSVMHWKPILPYMLPSDENQFEDSFIAFAEI